MICTACKQCLWGLQPVSFLPGCAVRQHCAVQASQLQCVGHYIVAALAGTDLCVRGAVLCKNFLGV